MLPGVLGLDINHICLKTAEVGTAKISRTYEAVENIHFENVGINGEMIPEAQNPALVTNDSLKIGW